MAVKASTETSVRQLTDQQRAIAVKLGEALTATQASLWEHLQQLQKVQDERGGQIESYVRARLTQAIQDVQKETRDSQMVIVSQTDEIRQNLALMERNVDGTLSQMMEHVQKLIEHKFVGRNLAEETSQIVQQQLQKSTDHVAATVVEHVFKLVDKLAMSQGRTSLTQEAAQIIQQQVERSTEGIAAEVMDHVQ
ncbi:uncharacterized protein IUM83_16403 [Phytophthora cinnamomi]|uniref:uncharacterized protein n=1 Tax=Phytophthora cinnamomi TaxID=4785 RepID=UPI00355A4DEE|nr:hypothetical protein IUM83_16403 [Phytophthora cinnamomi]